MGEVVHWVLMLVAGVLSVLAGLFAIFNPLAGSIAAVTIAGWGFLVLGVLELVAAFQAIGWGARLWAILLAVIAIIAGIQLLTDVLGGLFSLTFLLAVLFLASGIFKIIASFQTPGDLRWLVLLSGVVSLILAFMILSSFPASAMTILGILLGVELLSNGVSLITLSMMGRQVEA